MRLFLIIMILFCSVGFVEATTEESLVNDTREKKLVHIASQESAFKEVVCEKVISQIPKNTVSVSRVSLRELVKNSPQSYQAIVILNEIRAWRLNRLVRKFLRECDSLQREKIILVSTAAGIDWQTKETGIDAMTVASEMGTVDRLTKEIVKKLVILLGIE